MASCISCGSSTVAPGMCISCATSKWYVAILYYALVIGFFIFVVSRVILTADNIFSANTVKEFGMGQYFRNIGHIQDDSWIGEVKNSNGLYAYDAIENPTDSILLKDGILYEHWGYRKVSDTVSALCIKLYSSVDSSSNWFLKVPERWGWFSMQFSPKSAFVNHDVNRKLKKKTIDSFYADQRVQELVIPIEGKKKIRKYKADKAYKKIKAKRSFSIFQELLVPVVESILVPTKKRADFVLKTDQKELKKIEKAYFNKELMIEKYLIQDLK